MVRSASITQKIGGKRKFTSAPVTEKLGGHLTCGSGGL